MNEEELKALSRHRLQQEAKKLGIKANQSSSVLIQMILDSQSVNFYETNVMVRQTIKKKKRLIMLNKQKVS